MGFGTFLGVCLALVLWVVAAGYMFPAGMEHLGKGLKRDRDETLRSAFIRSNEELPRLWQETQRDAFWDRVGELIESAVWLAAGAVLFLIGLWRLFQLLPSSKVAAIVFGLAALATARWLRNHYRQLRARWRNEGRRENPPRAAQSGHAWEVFLHLAGIIILPIVGVLLLLSVF
jgi:hypothetical protein